MVDLADYEAWKTQRQRSAIGAANIVLGAVNSSPDEAAKDLQLGEEFAKATASPQPPTSLISANRLTFQRIADQAKASTALSSSPMLAEWLRNPDNAAVASDDLHTLNFWEGLGNSISRGVQGVGQSIAQREADTIAQSFADRNKSIGDIYAEEAARPGWHPLSTLLRTGDRFLSAAYGNVTGLNTEEKAAFWQQQSAAISQRIAETPMSGEAEAVRQKIGSISGDWQQQVGGIYQTIASDPVGFASFVVQMGVEFAPEIAAATAATAATRNPAVGAAFLGGESAIVNSGNKSLEWVQKAGFDLTTPEGALAAVQSPGVMKTAAERGQTYGLIVGALDGLSGGLAGKTLLSNPLGNMVVQMLAQAGLASAGEAAGQLASGQQLSPIDIILEGLGEFASAPLEVVGLGHETWASKTEKARRGEATKAVFEQLSGQAQQSKLRQRLPGKFAEWVEAATKDGPVANVYVPAEAWVTYWQSQGIDPHEIAASIGGVTADDVDTALATGGDLKIPTASYAATMAGSEHDAFMFENMKFDPNDYTAKEAADFNARARDALQEAYELADAVRRDEETYRAAETQIYQEMVSRLRTAGRATDVARSEAMLYPAFYRTMAERSGMPVEDFLAKFPLPQIRGEVPEGMKLKNVDALTRTLTAARAQKTAGLDQGQSLLEFISARGGMNDVGGELAARDAEVIKRGKGKKTLRLSRKGFVAGMKDMLGGSSSNFSPDDVARAAVEAGYLSDDPTVLAWKQAQRDGTVAPDLLPALWAAVDRELRGTPEHATTAEPAKDDLGAIEEYLATLGKSLGDSDADIRSAIEADQAAKSGDASKRLAQADGSGFGTGAGLQGPRGTVQLPRGGVGNGDTVISLFKSADLSTFLHESGHYFLASMQAMAALDQDGQIAADFDTVKDWWHENADAVAKDAGAGVTPEDVRAAIEVGTSGDATKDAAIEVGMHEQFARAFETYAMEGEAPSIVLRGVFEKFRAWLLSIYRRAAGLNVQVSDELKGVFDRMLATDDEIAKARADSAATAPIFASAEEMGVDQKTYDAFVKLRQQADDEAAARLLREVMAPIKRAATKAYREERANVRADVERNLKASPVYRAIQELRFGKDYDGNEVVVPKLSREAIEKDYGDGWVQHLPGATKDGHGHKNAVFAKEGGAHPDMVAGLYGFPTGERLLDALSKAPDLKDAVNAETDKIMRERHNDPLLDGSVQQAALDAVHNDKRGQVLAQELRALNDIAGLDRGLTWKDAQESARRTIRTLKVRDAVRADRFLAAERRAGQDAQSLASTVTRQGMWVEAARRRVASTINKAVKTGSTRLAAGINAKVDAANAMLDSKDVATTRKGVEGTAHIAGHNENVARLVEAKRQQLLNHALYDEARRQRKEVDRLTAKAAKLNRPDAKQAKTRDIDFVKAARAVAARFGLARPDSAFDLAMWHEQLKADDPIAADTISQAIATYSQDARPYKDLTISELGAVKDALESLLETAKRNKLLEIEGRAVDREQAISELRDVIDGRAPSANAALSRKLTKIEKVKIGLLTIKASLLRMETWTRDMDDGKAGVFTKYLVRPVMDAIGRYRNDKAARLDTLLAIINPRRAELLGRAIHAPELKYTFENKGELLHAILHTGNESNLEKLLLGRGWSGGFIDQKQRMTAAGRPSFDRSGNPLMDRGHVDTSKWDTFVARMVREGVITKEDYDTAQAIWDLMEEIKRPAQSAHRKVYGYYFDEIEPRAIETPFGSYRGGYVPAIADNDASNDGQIRRDQEAMEQQQSSFMFPTTGAGFTKSRVRDYTTPLALNLMLLPAHMDKVLRFTHLNPAIRQTASLVTKGDLRAAIDGLDKTIIPNLITPWLQRTAQQAVEAQPVTPAGRLASAFFRNMRKRVGLQTMFANYVNAFQQVAGLAPAMILVKPSRVKNALIRYSLGGAGDMSKEVIAASPFMKDRLTNASRETLGRIQEAIVKPNGLDGFRNMVERHGYFLQQAMQNVVDVMVWHAAFDQAVAGGMDNDAAVFEADSVIRRTMGDFAPENVSMFETGGSFQRMFSMFYSYFNGQANLVGGEMQTAMRQAGWEGKGRMFWIYLMGMAVPAILGEAIVEGFKGKLGDEDDDGWLDDIGELFFGSQVRYALAMAPVVGPITNSLLNTFNGQFYDDRLSSSPVMSAADRAISTPSSILKAATGHGKASAATANTIYTLGLLLGVPTGELAKLAGLAVGKATGE